MRYLIMIIGIILSITSCVKKDEDMDVLYTNVENISSFNELRSHHAGENCMNCHYAGGTGRGFFSIAGSVYDSTKTQVFPNRLIRLYSEPQGKGTMIAEIQADGKGNFFTTDTINLTQGVYPWVLKTDGGFYSMSTKIFSGQCSKCHGVTTGNIWTK